MIKKYWVYALFVFAVAFFIYRFTSKHKRSDKIEITAKTYQTDKGWGYDIYLDDSVFIHQEYIPAIEGRKGFATEADARKTADLSISKIKNRKLPTILLSELDSLKISK